MSFVRSLAQAAFIMAMILGTTQCVGRKAKPVKVPKKEGTPADTTPPGGDQNPVVPGDLDGDGLKDDDGSAIDSDGDGIPDSMETTPDPTPIPPALTPTPIPPVPTPIPPVPTPDPSTPTPIPSPPPSSPSPAPAEDVTVTLTDGTTKTIQWNGKEHLDTTGKFKITNQ